MIATTRYLFILFLMLAFNWLYGQGINPLDTAKIPPGYKAEFRRLFNHDAIDNEQKMILASDGSADKIYTPSSNEEINFLLTNTLTKKVDVLQYLIETDKIFDHRLKVNYLKGLENILKNFRIASAYKSDKKVPPVELPLIVNAYLECMGRDRKSESIETIVDKLPYGAATVIMNADIFEKNAGFKPGKSIIVRKYCELHPEKTFLTLKDFPDVTVADSLIKAVAQKYPRQLYDYAAANNKLGSTIRAITDDIFVKSVARMAKSRSGQQYFPFLDNIVKGRMSFDGIDSVKDDSLQYYKLLVKTQMDYVDRMLNGDTAMEYESLSKKLETKAQEVFINTINGLHEADPVTRFRIIQPLSAEELYYLAVCSDGIIYTSSFVKGVYPLMMTKIGLKGDSLLKLLNFDRYRKFIKMAAAYNTLSNFLNSFSNPDDANNLMRAFVGRLENTTGLEDGVDVADSYASITEAIKPVAKDILNNIQLNYQRNLAADNKRGIAIYNILNKLFLSADTASKVDLTKELGIPPVYEVPFKSLANDSGRVIVQVFIFGDKDGIGVFPGLLNMFSNANWKIDRSNPQWVTINSVKGKPVSIYLNRPLPEENDEDNKAQKALCEYLEKNKLYPTVTINRGHSYNAPYTIEQMFATSRIVFMGSCGGYRMIHDILEKAPDAHIIGTKQIADVPVNNPFLQLLTEKLRNGNNIDWIPFWQELDKIVTNKIFEDYVPPYKNLGALFIKAYKKAMHEQDN